MKDVTERNGWAMDGDNPLGDKPHIHTLEYAVALYKRRTGIPKNELRIKPYRGNHRVTHSLVDCNRTYYRGTEVECEKAMLLMLAKGVKDEG